jgi:transmembrane sensor
MDASSRNRAVHDAARWYARLQAPDCTQWEREEFARWRERDPVHEQAYRAACRLAEDLFRTGAGDPRLEALADQAFAIGPVDPPETGASGQAVDTDETLESGATPEADCSGDPYGGRSVAVRSRSRMPVALAAGVLAAALLIGVARLAVPTDPAADARIATSTEQRRLALDDGTVVHLDVRTELAVRFTAARREVTLTRGRAIFDVAHDRRRPFSVSTDLGRVTALGTRFQVQRTREAVIVTLAEGAVSVSGDYGGRARNEGLDAGQELRFSITDSKWLKRDVDAQAATSWSLGRHVFRDVRLADALEEMNRYAAIKVRLADPALSDLRVSGNFVAGDSELAAAAFAAALPVRVSNTGEEILLFRRYGADAVDP